MQNVTKKCICIVLQWSIIRNKNSKIFLVTCSIISSKSGLRSIQIQICYLLFALGMLNNFLKYIWEVVNLGCKSCDC